MKIHMRRPGVYFITRCGRYLNHYRSPPLRTTDRVQRATCLQCVNNVHVTGTRIIDEANVAVYAAGIRLRHLKKEQS